MKKILSLLMCVSVIMCMFVGCKGDKTANNTEIRELKITKDYHYNMADDASLRSYEKLCTAVMNGEEEVKFNLSQIEAVNQLFYTSFPMTALVKSMVALEDGSGVKLTYVNDTEKHIELVNQFKTAVSDILISCNVGKVSTSRFVFNVYDYICKNMKIDESVNTSFDAIIKGAGSETVINSVFEYLLLQGDCKACHLVNFENKPCIMSAAQLNGDWYYFSPAHELVKTDGKALKYFAMNLDRVKQQLGATKFTYTDKAEAEELPDDSFSKLKDSVAYSVTDDGIKVDLGNKKIDLELS